MKWIIAIVSGFVFSSFLYLKLIEPQRTQLKIEKIKVKKIVSQHPKKSKGISQKTTSINQTIHQELKLHHCLVKKLSTNFDNAITFTLLATYPSIIHFLSLIEGNNCYNLVINSAKNTTLLQLKGICKND